MAKTKRFFLYFFKVIEKEKIYVEGEMQWKIQRTVQENLLGKEIKYDLAWIKNLKSCNLVQSGFIL